MALEPEIAANARFVGMHGAVRRGYRDSATPVPEYNVFLDVTAFRSVLATAWPITLTPLDTCGVVLLDGEDYARVRDAEDPLMQAVMANYRIWAQASGIPELPARRSSTLFDTVAVYLAFAEDLLEMENCATRGTRRRTHIRSPRPARPYAPPCAGAICRRFANC